MVVGPLDLPGEREPGLRHSRAPPETAEARNFRCRRFHCSVGEPEEGSLTPIYYRASLLAGPVRFRKRKGHERPNKAGSTGLGGLLLSLPASNQFRSLEPTHGQAARVKPRSRGPADHDRKRPPSRSRQKTSQEKRTEVKRPARQERQRSQPSGPNTTTDNSQQRISWLLQR